MAHRKWKETKQQPGTAGPGNMLGCCLVSFLFLWAILSRTRYSVDMVDVAQEMEKWAKWAALASAACLDQFSISSVTSTLSTLYGEFANEEGCESVN